MDIKLNSFKNLLIWSRDQNGLVTFDKNSLELIFGYEKDEYIKNENLWFEIIYPDDKTYFMNAINEAKLSEEKRVNVQFRVIGKDSIIRNLLGEICFHAEYDQVKYSGYVVDVSSRNQNFDINKHRKNLLNLLSQSISSSFELEINRLDRVNKVLGSLGEITKVDRVYIFDKKTGDNENPVLGQNYEWCKEGIESQMSNDVVLHVELKDLVPTWYDSLVLNRKSVSGIVRHLSPIEREILEPQGIISILVTPIWYDAEFFGFIGFDDCSEERVWSEEEIELLTVFGSLIIASWKYEDSVAIVEEQLKELRKLQGEREQFFKMVSHQFKTPLSVIKLNTNLIDQICSRIPSGNVQMQKNLQRINNSIDKFEELIEAILIGSTNYSLEENAEKIFLKEWFRHFVAKKISDFQDLKSFQVNFESDFDYQINMPFSLKTFEYIIDTLFSNSMKYRGINKTSINVNLLKTPESLIQLKFNDKGIGIDNDDLGRIAEPFFRANNVIDTSGTGIGLSIVKEALKHVGGKFKIESKLGEYTNVTLTFPFEKV